MKRNVCIIRVHRVKFQFRIVQNRSVKREMWLLAWNLNQFLNIRDRACDCPRQAIYGYVNLVQSRKVLYVLPNKKKIGTWNRIITDLLSVHFIIINHWMGFQDCRHWRLCQDKNVSKFPLPPMGVLAPSSAHARPSARPPINTSGNFPAHMSAESPSNISPNPSEVISEVSEP